MWRSPELAGFLRSSAPTALAVLALLGGLGVGLEAQAETCRRVAPSQFGRVFRANRSVLVRIRAEKPGARWRDGVVIGAEGEILFGFARGVGGRLRVRGPDGLERGATVLGFDRALGVGVARPDSKPARRVAPPRVQLDARLSPDCWLVVLTHDKAGAPTSHAGQVGKGGGKGRVRVDVPGRVGSPLFSAEGALVGISVTRGRRRVTMQPMANLMAFLRRVVIGGR